MKPIFDQSRLVDELNKLGLSPPCRLMVHSSLRAMGLVEGGAETVVNALRQVAGEDGAIIAPSFRDAIRSEYYGLQQCKNCCPRDLCPSREQGHTGIIGETVRQQLDSLRSCHPSHSWVGICGDARFVLEGHRNSLTPCGVDSPFSRLLMRDGKILLLGVGVNSLTNIHFVEDIRNVAYLSAYDSLRRHATYTTSGKRIQYVYPQLLAAAMAEIGILRSERIGAATCYVISARALASLLWVATEDNLWCLVLRPHGDQYEPFEDACAKISGMVKAWKRNPDEKAWSHLLEASKKPIIEPVQFEPSEHPAIDCPAYRGLIRDYHRCAANDLPPGERFEDYPPGEPGVATCGQCNWTKEQGN